MARHPSENKQVMFSDGIRPGGDLTHLDERPEGASSGGSKKKKSCGSPICYATLNIYEHCSYYLFGYKY